MSIQVLTNAKLYIAGYDLSGDSNEIKLDYSAAMLNNTRFGGTTKISAAGLRDAGISGKGFWRADATPGNVGPDDVLWPLVGAAIASNPVVVTSPTGAADGDPAYFLQAALASYPVGASVGDALPFEFSAQNYGAALVSGKIGATGSKASTGTGTIYQLGAIAAGQKLFAAVHVLGITGSVVVKIQSAPAVGFGSPTDRITFNSTSAVGAQFGSVAGAITDQYWRVSWTVTTGPANIVVAFGIAS
jgi:hypothetical protein